MRRTAKRIFWGLFWASVGTVLLLANYGAINYRFSLARDWPALLVLLGISKLIDSLTNQR